MSHSSQLSPISSKREQQHQGIAMRRNAVSRLKKNSLQATVMTKKQCEKMFGCSGGDKLSTCNSHSRGSTKKRVRKAKKQRANKKRCDAKLTKQERERERPFLCCTATRAVSERTSQFMRARVSRFPCSVEIRDRKTSARAAKSSCACAVPGYRASATTQRGATLSSGPRKLVVAAEGEEGERATRSPELSARRRRTAKVVRSARARP